MNSRQQSAIDTYQADLIDSLLPQVEVVLSHLTQWNVLSGDQRELISFNTLARDKVIDLLGLLRQKDDGWAALVRFLTENHMVALAARLQDVGDKPNPKTLKTNAQLHRFYVDLVQYYEEKFCRFDHAASQIRSIRDVWVPLQLVTTWPIPSEQLDQTELLVTLLSPNARCQVALIEGHQGVGKTTLLRKIVSDWCQRTVQSGSVGPESFACVLLAELNSVAPAEDLLEMAVDIHLRLHNCGGLAKPQLISLLSGLGSKLLIAADGLSELRPQLAASPFRNLFAPPFSDPTVPNSLSPTKAVEYRTIVTSRPYAVCSCVTPTFRPTRLRIEPLDAGMRRNLADLYCQTPVGRDSVDTVLDTEDFCGNPLALVTICQVADINPTATANLTCLYGAVVERLLRREVRRGSVKEQIDWRRWRESQLVKTTSQLAFSGVYADQWEFDQIDLQRAGVDRESFTAGLLQYHLGVGGKDVRTTFAHRSFQVFFAALHSVTTEDLRLVRLAVGSQMDRGVAAAFERFVMGISAEVGQFERLLDSWSPSFARCKVAVGADAFLHSFALGLSDVRWTDAVLYGRRLTVSLDKYVDIATSVNREEIWWLKGVATGDISQLSGGLREGLRLELVRKKEGSGWDWWIRGDGNVARLACICGPPETNYRWIAAATVVWLWAEEIPRRIGTQIQLIPPNTSSLVIRAGHFSQAEVILELDGVDNPSQLNSFSFGCSLEGLARLRYVFYDTSETRVRVTRRLITPQRHKLVWGRVELRSCHTWTQLVESLLHAAIQLLIGDE